VLILATSLAVASVSVWLVLPYLALMAVILITPPGRRRHHEDGTEASDSGRGRGEELAAEPHLTGTEDGAGIIDRATSDPATVAELVVELAEVSASDPDSDSELRAVKTRRGGSGKGRLRKAKAVVASPGGTATWIQVGPGKFVRVEAPGPQVAAESQSPSPGGTVEAEGANTGDAEDTEVLESTPEAPSDSDEIASEGGDDAAPARDPENQAPAASEEPLVVEDDPDTAMGMEETWDSGLSTDAVVVAVAEGDNGIAPDAFDVVPPALTVTMNEILTEDASSPEPDRGTPEPAVRSAAPDRRNVGTLLAPRREVGWYASSPLSERSRSLAVRDVSSSRRRVRSGRKSRVSPALQPRSRQRGAVRPRQARRTFPPRSPPIPMGRLRAGPEHGDGPWSFLRQTPRGAGTVPVLVRCGARRPRREIASRVPEG
jgi:hypothetical protein